MLFLGERVTINRDGKYACRKPLGNNKTRLCNEFLPYHAGGTIIDREICDCCICIVYVRFDMYPLYTFIFHDKESGVEDINGSYYRALYDSEKMVLKNIGYIPYAFFHNDGVMEFAPLQEDQDDIKFISTDLIVHLDAAPFTKAFKKKIAKEIERKEELIYPT